MSLISLGPRNPISGTNMQPMMIRHSRPPSNRQSRIGNSWRQAIPVSGFTIQSYVPDRLGCKGGGIKLVGRGWVDYEKNLVSILRARPRFNDAAGEGRVEGGKLLRRVGPGFRPDEEPSGGTRSLQHGGKPGSAATESGDVAQG